MKKDRREFLKKAGTLGVGFGWVSVAPLASYASESQSQSCSPCTLDYYGEGPFYTANPPEIVNGQLAASNEPGDRLVISGRVTNLDCTEFIADAVIDVWHADDSGAYDNVGFKLRGKTKTDEQGFYSFETIKPGKYLNGQEYRPSHIHFKITAPGKPVLTTQLYFAGDTSIPNDAAASITAGTYDASKRIIPLVNVNGKLEGTWDIAVAGEGELISTGISTQHLDKGIIYRAFPNPFHENISINLGVFNRSRVTLELINQSGRIVNSIDQGELDPDKYEITWNLGSSLPAGNYLLAIKVNDMQVHHIKVIKDD